MTSARSLSLASFDASPWSRREFVRGLGFGMLGMGLPEMMRGRAAANQMTAAPPAALAGKAKRCIMVFLFGGPSQIDTWDMKPSATAEHRGEFQQIATAVPGISCCEHLPRTAKLTKHLAIIRSLTMSGRSIGDHHADTYYVLTGHQPDRSFFVDGINRKPHPGDWPCIGSTVASRLPANPELPGLVQLPARSGEVTNYINPGQFAGRLGPAWEPLLVRGELEKPRQLAVPAFELPADLRPERLAGRQTLLKQLDAWQSQVERPGGPLETLQTHQRRALSLLTSAKSKEAFDISREPEATRARYGEDINGQSLLMARRLVESGVPFVCVHWIGRKVGAGLSWDTHSDNFGQLKNVLLPAFDAGFSALLEYLEARGLLEETVVLVAAEMGRTPKVGDPRTGGKGPPGRDHWIHCQTALMAGGGIQGGQHFGASDRIAAYPADRPVYPEDLAATVYHALGIDQHLAFTDREGRIQSLLDEGQPLPLF
ncbi:MAG: DUF1501 domain-containing protein [Pirellulaceae bacterium]